MALTFEPSSQRPLDPLDLKILKILMEDSKMPFADIGSKINLTAPAVHARVKKMEKLGIIKNYSIEVDYSKIGLPVTSFVRIKTGKTRCKDAAKEMTQFSEIEECHTVAGEDDLILKVRTSTPLELQNLLDKLKVKELVDRSVSIFVLESHIEKKRLP